MARLKEDQWETLEADYHTGMYSKNQLAEKYEISHTAVNKRLKDIKPKFQDLVSTQIAIKAELSEQSFKQVSAIETVVSEAMKNRNLVFGVTQKAMKKLQNMIDNTDNPNDIKTIIDASDKASLTLGVNPRFANTQIQQNNNMSIEVEID